MSDTAMANGTAAGAGADGVAAPAAAAADPATTAAAASPTASAALSTLESRVATAPQDFDAWCALVAEAEKTNDLSRMRVALNGLLAQFPLCFGYWSRLAKHEAAGGSAEALAASYATFERGLEAIPHSHELWTMYVTELMKNEAKPVEEIRSFFQRGASVLSTDCSASAFWDKYLDFELQQFASPTVQASLQLLPPPYCGTLIAKVYALVLSLPLKDVEKFWASFSGKFAVNYPLNYLATPEEAAEYTAQYPTAVPEDRKATVSLTEYANEWELEQRRALLAKREYSFRVSVTMRDERYLFEQAITRPYFHIAPLPPTEIANWNNYLDFAESKLLKHFNAAQAQAAAVGGTPADMNTDTLDPTLLADVVKLYERALIPCAQYAELWDRYANFMLAVGEPMRAYEVRQRSLFFLRNNVVANAPQAPAQLQEACVALAQLEEKQGNADAARSLLQQAVAIRPLAAAASAPAAAPGMPAPAQPSDSHTPYLEAVIAQLRFEARQWLLSHLGKERVPFDGDDSIGGRWRSALQSLHPDTTKSIASTKSYIYLALQYTQFILTQADIDDAARIERTREVFERACATLFPAPVTTTAQPAVPLPPTADGTTPLPTTTTVVPRIPASRIFAVFFLSWIEFETAYARAPLSRLAEIFERALRQRATVPADITPPPAGASGLSDASKRQLWAAYIAVMEDRSSNIVEIDRVRDAAKQALRLLATTATATAAPAAHGSITTLLGKRRHAASPTPIAQPPAKTMRVAPPAPAPAPMPYGGRYGAYGGGAYAPPSHHHAASAPAPYSEYGGAAGGYGAPQQGYGGAYGAPQQGGYGY